ncbi:hypothetical protein [Floridanema evergladense]|uniref:Uncharacterized protein n=1 Tax=Floridaenema evergladense BLCC-F167 TaxID=3153639 RepID=A0ABV4WX85_9CYAN
MKKSLFSEDYKCFLNLLREARERAGLTQEHRIQGSMSLEEVRNLLKRIAQNYENEGLV